jgi:hypothetical protein
VGIFFVAAQPRRDHARCAKLLFAQLSSVIIYRPVNLLVPFVATVQKLVLLRPVTKLVGRCLV